jgi:dimethylaniline monooxygenase (N-oxide forming)
MRKVAVIGAGPGGLVAARYLKSEGFNPVVHEQGARVGGQWSADPYHSGVWPAMRTNTSRIMTSFSDLPHYAGCPTYPTNEEMGNICSATQRLPISFRTSVSTRQYANSVVTLRCPFA